MGKQKTLTEYYAEHGRGAQKELIKASGLSSATVNKAAKGDCTVETALRISAASGYEVNALLILPDEYRDALIDQFDRLTEDLENADS